jgi:hypothetical protein
MAVNESRHAHPARTGLLVGSAVLALLQLVLIPYQALHGRWSLVVWDAACLAFFFGWFMVLLEERRRR